MQDVDLVDVTKSVRSKNAGVDHITFDVIFSDREIYEYVKENDLITREQILDLYDVDDERLAVFTYFDPAKAVKFTFKRNRPSGSPGEHDVMGAQQYSPLFDISLALPQELAD
jgi:hypothetical protein